jgi:hypothetical protein
LRESQNQANWAAIDEYNSGISGLYTRPDAPRSARAQDNFSNAPYGDAIRDLPIRAIYFFRPLDISEILRLEKRKIGVFIRKPVSEPHLATAAQRRAALRKLPDMSKDRPLFGPPTAEPVKVAPPPAPPLQPPPAAKPPRQQPKP